MDSSASFEEVKVTEDDGLNIRDNQTVVTDEFKLHVDQGEKICSGILV